MPLVFKKYSVPAVGLGTFWKAFELYQLAMAYAWFPAFRCRFVVAVTQIP